MLQPVSCNMAIQMYLIVQRSGISIKTWEFQSQLHSNKQFSLGTLWGCQSNWHQKRFISTREGLYGIDGDFSQ